MVIPLFQYLFARKFALLNQQSCVKSSKTKVNWDQPCDSILLGISWMVTQLLKHQRQSIWEENANITVTSPLVLVLAMSGQDL